MEYEAIIFDLGGVIINLDPGRSLAEFQKRVPGMRPETFNGKEMQLPIYSEFEVGKLNAVEMLNRFNSHYGSALTLGEFSAAWNAMILDLPLARLKLIRNLRKAGIRVFLLSNINEIHEKFVDALYASLGQPGSFRDLFEHAYYSHLIGLRKPNAEIFEHVIKEEKLDPAKTLFIDDSIHHLRTAATLGIHTAHITEAVEILDLEIFQEYL